ncbi:hypothetical protein D0A22_15725 [Stutzerimonas stutzeri]|nr:hypothetical protein D0A22_15725 [Stutzerimonas stutzeri]
MHAAIAALPPFHPRVIQASYKPLIAALVPRYVQAVNQDTSLPKSKLTVEALARSVLQRTLSLLVEHQGTVPVREALSYLMRGAAKQPLTDIQEKTAGRLLELVMECSELIVTNCEGSTFSLHPEWSRRFCERYEQKEARVLAMTAHWDLEASEPSKLPAGIEQLIDELQGVRGHIAAIESAFEEYRLERLCERLERPNSLLDQQQREFAQQAKRWAIVQQITEEGLEELTMRTLERFSSASNFSKVGVTQRTKSPH